MIDSNKMTYSSIGSVFTQASLAVTVQKKKNRTKNENKTSLLFQAYKSNLFGARFVWILIGTYTQQWWSVPDPSVECSKEEMQKAVAYTFIFNNQIFVNEENKEKQNKTLSRLVSICNFLLF